MQMAELRRWHRETVLGLTIRVIGYVYNDPDDTWDDGELAELEVRALADSGNFYILHTFGRKLFRLVKDEEDKHKSSARQY
jgi:hypothetical protein